MAEYMNVKSLNVKGSIAELNKLPVVFPVTGSSSMSLEENILEWIDAWRDWLFMCDPGSKIYIQKCKACLGKYSYILQWNQSLKAL